MQQTWWAQLPEHPGLRPGSRQVSSSCRDCSSQLRGLRDQGLVPGWVPKTKGNSKKSHGSG